jgi:hypothetical protein
MKVHRLHNAIVTICAVIFLVAGRAKIRIVLRCVLVIGSELEVVGSTAQTTAWQQRTYPGKRTLHAVTRLGQMARGAAITGSLAIMASLARPHGWQMLRSGFFNLRKIPMTARTRGFSSHMRRVTKLEIGYRQLNPRHTALAGRKPWMAANARGRGTIHDLFG